LAQRAVGVVLSGGGARALSHIGVLAGLCDAGVRIDRVGGVSMGAVIGSLWAVGHSPEEIDAILYDELVRRNPLNDYTVPRISLIRGEKVKAVMRRLVGTVAIEELERGFLCTTADLRSGQLVVHRSGPLWEHVSTSFSIPVIAPPRVEGRRLLVDGGVVNNLPVAPLAATGEGPVIAVAVKMTGDERRPRGNGAKHDGQRPVRPPRLGETLMRTMVLASANMDQEARTYSSST
jgi:predicted acylesterase/phospholipase RssA